MYIIPAIDLYNGCAVRLKKGDYEQMTVYSNNPPEFAEKFEKAVLNGFTLSISRVQRTEQRQI